MAVKTITIDMEAYDLLAHLKTEGRSFSEVIKAHFAPLPTAARFKKAVRKIHVAPATLDAMEAIVAARASEPARAAR